MESDFDFSLYWAKGAFALGGGVNGIFSFEQDDYGDAPGDKPFRAVGSTNTINSVDRSYYQMYGAIHLSLSDRLRGELLGGQVLSGEFWDQQGLIQFNLVFHGGERAQQQKQNQQVREVFKDYEVEAEVVKVSPRGTLVKIDKGFSSGINKGMRFDIYDADGQRTSVLVASGAVFKVNSEDAIVKILQVFREDKDAGIKEGYAARGKR